MDNAFNNFTHLTFKYTRKHVLKYEIDIFNTCKCKFRPSTTLKNKPIPKFKK